MKNIFLLRLCVLLLSLLLLSPRLLAQCPTENVLLSTQAQVDAFPSGCPTIFGSLTISGNDITNLNALSQLNYVGRNVFISSNNSLTSLTGLNSLTTIGQDLWIGKNTKLSSLSALSQLRNLNYDITIISNNSLTSLTGLNSLTSIKGYLFIADNSLNSLSGLEQLRSVGSDVIISLNNNLTTLAGLNSLTNIGGNATIDNNNNLSSLSGLEQLRSIGGRLTVSDNTRLTTCAIESICQLLATSVPRTISNNASGCNSSAEVEAICAAPTITGFAANTEEACVGSPVTFTATIGNFSGNYGWSLSNGGSPIGSPSPVTSTTLTVVLPASSSGMQTYTLTVTSSGQTTTAVTSVRVNAVTVTNPGVATATVGQALSQSFTASGGSIPYSFSVLSSNLPTSLSVSNAGVLSGTPTQAGSYSVTVLATDAIGCVGTFTNYGLVVSAPVAQCPTGNVTLTTQAQVDAFPAGCSTLPGSLTISGADITNLIGLQSLTRVRGSITIVNNAALPNLSGLQSLTSVNGLAITNNPSLTSVSSLSSLRQMEYYLYIDYNAALPNLNGLQSFTSIEGSMRIEHNRSLTSVSSLSALRQIPGELSIIDNAALLDLSGFQSLTRVGSLSIFTNPSLRSVSSLSALRQVGGSLLIGNNAILPNLLGMELITSISGNLGLTNNPSLTSVSGLSAIRQVAGFFSINSNYTLPTLNGLESLTSIGSDLEIYNNPSLTSVSGLSTLQRVAGNFRIFDNNTLPTLSGFGSLTNVGGNLRVQDNPQLSICATEPICRLLATLPTNRKTISGNAPGCASLADVEANCLGLTGLTASPNPVCLGNLVTFTATVGDMTGSYNYTLTNGSDLLSGTATGSFNQSLTATGLGIQSYTLMVSNSGTPASVVTSLTVVPSNVTRLYVKANATGANTGLSWGDAFTDLQSALKYPCIGSLQEIWIARGVYKPRSTLFTDAFSMLPDVAIFGGFEGTETNLSQRPPITLNNPSSTTLSADIDGDGTEANNTGYLVYNTRRLTNTAILDGVVITQNEYLEGATAGSITNVSSGNPADEIEGQPIGSESSPQFRNLLFTGYLPAVQNARWSPVFIVNKAMGGGVTKPIFINCVFRDNQFGTIYNEGGFLSSGTSTVVAPQFVNCIIANHTYTNLPFLSINQYASTDQSAFINCSFLNVPGGVSSAYIDNTTGASQSDLQMTNCVLWNTGGANTFKTQMNGSNPGTSVATTVQYSLLDQTITGYTSGPGNLTVTSSPFVSGTDVNLPNSSSAVNAGNPASVTVASAPYSATNLPQADAAANPRIVGGRVDMGALEAQTTTPPCGTVVYVTQNGAGSQNGSSWTDAFSGTALQTAINTAAGCGAQVWVAQGLYKPTTSTDRSISFSMKEGVAIYGGFRGTEGQLGERPGVNPVTGQPSSSTLSGDIGTPGDSGEDSDNSGHVISNGPGLTASAVLDGFVITKGTGDDGSVLYGGGMRNVGASPTVRNCFFIDNNGNDRGGAIYNEDSSPTVTNCRFEANSASYGGAIYNEGAGMITITGCLFEKHIRSDGGTGTIYSADNIRLVVSNSTFRQNANRSTGGAIYDIGTVHLELTDCLLENNTSETAGGIFHQSNGSIKLTRCQFVSNSSMDDDGGAIYFTTIDSRLEAIDCQFTSNSAARSGGAISFGGSSLKLDNCVFANNRGGGDGGGAVFVNSGSATLINTSFVSNTATNRGAVLFYGDDHQIINCSFVNNVATEPGGAIYNSSTSLQVINSSFQGNQSPQGEVVYSDGGRSQLVNSVLFNNGGANTFLLTNGASLSASYSLLEPGVTGYIDGGINITTTVSPFVSTTSTQLRDCSPAINTGSNTAYSAVNGPATDLAGNARRYNNSVIDRGAYEYQGNPTTLTISNPAISTATVGQAFSQSFTASGGSGSYSFSVVNSNLPASLSLSGSGVLSGTPTAAGSYSVLVQVSDANGCVGQASTAYSLTVSNEAMPTITGFAVAPNPVCVGSPITFTATIGYIAGNYGWSLSSGGPPIGSPSPTTVTAFSVVQTALVSGVQTFTLTINSGGQVVTATTSLTVNPLPTASLTNNGPLTCAQTSVTLTASGGISYSFTNGSGQEVPGSGNTRTVSSPGTYSVTVRDVSGCVSATTTAVGSNTVLSLASGATLPQANVGVVVSLTASGANSYQWIAPATAPLTTPATGSAVSASLTTAGVQTFTVVGSSGVCSQSALVSVTALAGPDLSAIINLPDANFSAGDSKGLLVRVQEVNGALASGNIIVTITVPAGYSVSFDNTLTSFSVSGGGTTTVQNNQWHQSSVVAGQQISIAINDGRSVGAGSTMNLGFSITRTTANAGSVSNITVNVADDNGGQYDVNRLNNVYARIINGL